MTTTAHERALDECYSIIAMQSWKPIEKRKLEILVKGYLQALLDDAETVEEMLEGYNSDTCNGLWLGSRERMLKAIATLKRMGGV